MRPVSFGIMAAAILTAPSLAAAQTVPPTRACITIDRTRDRLPDADRQVAVILVARELERAGRTVVDAGCDERYELSHIGLGNTLIVTLAGPVYTREGKAAGLDDLPFLYGQLVRAVLTGSDVGAMDVVDRTNVTTPQAHVRRVGVDSFGYGRLGYGAMLGAGGSHNPAFGFGWRAELDTFALDFSFFNLLIPSYNEIYGGSGSGTAASFFKIEALHFVRPRTNASAYFGGGLSLGSTSGPDSSTSGSYSSWHGGGLQGELTGGYEWPRATDLRVFVQADASLPFYSTYGVTTNYSSSHTTTVSMGSRYNPSIAVSVGIGWKHHRY